MALTVVVRSGDTPSQATITFDAPRIVIGRGPGCEVRLPDPSVSHRHASIRQRGTDYVVIDEGSTNGTFAGAVRLSPQAPRIVKSGDLIRVGRIWLELRIEQRMPTQSGSLVTAEIALGLVANALRGDGAVSAPRLSVESGPDRGKELVLEEFERAYVIGRAKGVDLLLTDPDASRRHVELLRRGPYVYARDLGSKNGAMLAGKALDAGRDVVWSVSARLTIGDDTILLEDPVAAALAEIEAGSDERMRADEEIEAPNLEAAPASADPQVAREPSAPADSAAPIAEVPRRSASPAPKKGRLYRIDVLIALAAITVIALSLLGIAWLFRAN